MTDEQKPLLERLEDASVESPRTLAAVGSDDPKTVGRIAGPLCDEISSLRALCSISADRIESDAALIRLLVEAGLEARQGIQAFLDMVNVIQKVQALPIPVILETAQHNCPILLARLDQALAAARQGETKCG